MAELASLNSTLPLLLEAVELGAVGKGSTEIRVLAWFRRLAPNPNSFVRPS